MSINQVCPICKGDGSGNASIKGLTTGSGMCPDCHGSGEVTPTKRERLLRRGQ